MVVESFNVGRVFFEFLTIGSKHNRPLLSSPQSLFQSEYKSVIFVGV